MVGVPLCCAASVTAPVLSSVAVKDGTESDVGQRRQHRHASHTSEAGASFSRVACRCLTTTTSAQGTGKALSLALCVCVVPHDTVLCRRRAKRRMRRGEEGQEGYTSQQRPEAGAYSLLLLCFVRIHSFFSRSFFGFYFFLTRSLSFLCMCSDDVWEGLGGGKDGGQRNAHTQALPLTRPARTF